MKDFNVLGDQTMIDKTAVALRNNGIEVFVAENGAEAKQKLYELMPKGSEVMVMTSETLRAIGAEKEVNESGEYVSVKPKIAQLPKEEARQKKYLGAAPQISIGSVHAVTQDGKVMVASNTGSQLPGYVFGSDKVIWVVGAQKLVKDLAEGEKRIFDYVLPLETVRARAAYHLPDTYNSYPSKLLIFNREIAKDRITMIIVKEVLGF